MLEDLVRVTNATGRLGIVGVYLPQDPRGVDPHAKHGEFELPWGQVFNLMVGVGQTPVKKYNAHLRDLIVGGRAKPSKIVSNHLPLDRAAEGYKQFDQRGDGWTR